MQERNSLGQVSLPSKRKQRGFTLIELLVVVAIIALLVAILVPALEDARNMAKRVVCTSNMHQLTLGTIMYAENNDGQFPGRSGYNVWTLNYFEPGPGGPTSNASGDFSGIYPDYVNTPQAFYCPDSPWRADSEWPGPGTPFYYWATGHGIWGRYTTYDYFGWQTSDYVRNNPALDINGEAVEFPSSLLSPPGLVFIADYSAYNSLLDVYGYANHPAQTTGALGPHLPRQGTNVGLSDGSAKWKDESDTIATFQWRVGQWCRF